MRRIFAFVAAVCFLAPPGVQMPVSAEENLGWHIFWANEAMVPSLLRQNTEESLSRLMTGFSGDETYWARVSTGKEDDLAISMNGGASPLSIRYEMPSACNQVVVVTVEIRGGEWCVVAQPFAAWLTEPSSRYEQCLGNPSLLAVTIGQLLRQAWLPVVEVESSSGNRLKLQVKSAAKMSYKLRMTKWPLDSIWSVITAEELSKRAGYRSLKFAYAKLEHGIFADGTGSAALLAIESTRRKLDELIKQGQSVFLVPAVPAPGPIRIRPIDGSTRVPLPNVEVHASRQSHDEAVLRGVSPPTGDAVEFFDEQGAFWYVTLISGSSMNRLWILNDGRGEVLELPIAAGGASLVLDELKLLTEGLKYEYRAFKQALDQAGQLAVQRRFTEAHQQYNVARGRLPNAEYACRQAHKALNTYGQVDQFDSATETDEVSNRCQEFRTITQECSAQLAKYIEELLRIEDLASRQNRAKELVLRASQHRDDHKIDEALRLYDEAIQILPTAAPYRTQLVEQRERLARSWQIRGGAKQEQARIFVFTRLPAVTPEQAIRDFPGIRNHLVCLINNGDYHTLRRALVSLEKLADRLLTHVRDATESKELDSARTAREVFQDLDTLMRRTNSALGAD